MRKYFQNITKIKYSPGNVTEQCLIMLEISRRGLPVLLRDFFLKNRILSPEIALENWAQ